eukprot:Gb_06333 [translate_table: standard]
MIRRKSLPPWQVVLAWVFFLCFPIASCAQNHSRPTIVRIGALLSLHSRSGKSIKMALELALDKVNGDPSFSNGTKFELLVADSNCSALQSATSGWYARLIAQLASVKHTFSFKVCYKSSGTDNDCFVTKK